MPVKKTKTKRNPQDVTLRNVQAANKRFDALEKKLAKYENRLAILEEDMDTLWSDYEMRLNTKI